MAVASG